MSSRCAFRRGHASYLERFDVNGQCVGHPYAMLLAPSGVLRPPQVGGPGDASSQMVSPLNLTCCFFPFGMCAARGEQGCIQGFLVAVSNYAD